MPVKVRKGKGRKPWKLVNRAGKVEGSSTTKKKAQASARIRNARSAGYSAPPRRKS